MRTTTWSEYKDTVDPEDYFQDRTCLIISVLRVWTPSPNNQHHQFGGSQTIGGPTVTSYIDSKNPKSCNKSHSLL